jgi:glycosyltransferase involved in cell wall biosynthesis
VTATPRVTVVMATYNWSSVLPFSIGSVIDQTWTDFELLVIGDGCTDDTSDVVAAVADERVAWIDLQPGTGHQCGPNNEGMGRGRGDLIAYLGHDDVWLPRHLEVLVAAVDDGHRFVHAPILLVDPHHPPTRHPADGVAFEPGQWIAPTSVMHDRRLALELGGWPAPSTVNVEDPEAVLWARLHRRSPLYRVPELTSIKIAAGLRRDVYRHRPSLEQAYWLDRIRRADDPASDVAAAAGAPYLLATTAPDSAWPPETPGTSAADRIAERQRFKGVERVSRREVDPSRRP